MTTARDLPEWMYSTRDAKSARILELEAALLLTEAALIESNDTAARYAEITKSLTLMMQHEAQP